MQNYFLKRAKTLTFACLFLLISVFSVSGQSMFRKILDFDGDSKADFAVVRSENNLKFWYVWQSTAGFRAIQWGLATDSAAAGDYDGDGKTDFAVYRRQQIPSSNTERHDFYILQSSNNLFVSKSFTAIRGFFYNAHQQDYDGDGKTDPAVAISYEVYYGEFILQSSNNTLRTTGHGYLEGSIKIGDMDGDGNAESAARSFNNNNIVKWTNLTTGNTRSINFGVPEDVFFTADFDGDGKGDLTVWRRSEGNWYWLRSSDNVLYGMHWGLPDDVPVPADYDGDGCTDQAVYRRGSPNGIYYINGSQSGFRAFVWGSPNDFPVMY
ncbi:MAG: VCBS repeat-containing protein [Acidobacteriota bacterium]|nr:VCBS repeat-containing protein [Acidobacteriota bacterium]